MLFAAAALCFFGTVETKTWELEIEQDLNQTVAAQAVATVMHDCKTDQFKPRVEKVTCTEIVKGDIESLACYARTNIGFFFVTKGYMDIAVITYHRFD